MVGRDKKGKGGKRRTIREISSDIKANRRRKSSKKKIQKSISNNDSSGKEKKDSKYKTLEKSKTGLEIKSRRKDFVKIKTSKDERKAMEGSGLSVKKVRGLRPTAEAKRAKRRLEKVSDKQKKIIKRKTK